MTAAAASNTLPVTRRRGREGIDARERVRSFPTILPLQQAQCRLRRFDCGV